MGQENRIEDQDQEKFRSLWVILQEPVRDTFGDRTFADLETPDGFLNLPRVGLSGARWQGS